MTSRRTPYILLALGVGGLAAIQIFVSLPGDRWYWRDIQNLGHVPLYAVVAVLFWLVARRLPALADRPERQYLAAGLASLAVGIAAEGVQALGLGDADPFDVLRDLAGIIPALLIIYVIVNRRTLDHRKIRRRIGLAISLAALSLIPFGYSAYCVNQRASHFPVLADFDSGWQKRFVLGDDAELRIVSPPPEWALADTDLVGELLFSDTGYPGLEIDEPEPDWSGYQSLKISVFNPTDTLAMTVRIDDRQHNGEFEDRFNERYILAPGADTIVVPLETVRAGPHSRDLDLTDLQKVMLFTRPGPTRLYIDKIWLE